MQVGQGLVRIVYLHFYILVQVESCSGSSVCALWVQDYISRVNRGGGSGGGLLPMGWPDILCAFVQITQTPKVPMNDWC